MKEIWNSTEGGEVNCKNGKYIKKIVSLEHRQFKMKEDVIAKMIR